MTLSELLERNCVAVDLKVTSKKQLIQEMADIMVDCDCLGNADIQARDIIAASMERERLGSTGVGSGIALPHARIEGLEKVIIAIVRLETPVDFESIDERPVDVAVLILAPMSAGSDHLRALAVISRRLRDEDVRARLRRAPDAESFYTTFIGEAQASAA